MMQVARFQIGKHGITEGIVDSLLLVFKKHKIIRISLLQASGRDKEKTREMAEELSEKLKNKSHYIFSHTIIGFTIVMRRHAK